MEEGGEDHQVRRPGVDRADQPTELDLRHQELHRLEGIFCTGAVVE